MILLKVERNPPIDEGENLMKKPTILIGCLSFLLLASCGVEDTTKSNTETTEILSDRTAESEKKETTVIEQRNELEWEQLLDYDSDRQRNLSELQVNLNDDTEEIQTMGQTVLEYLKAGDVDSAVAMVEDASWMSVMLPKLVIGQRNYRTDSAEIPERITVISDELGQQYTALECATEDGKAIYLEITPAEIHSFVSEWQDEKLQGTFSSEILRMEDGAYRKYEGTISADGKVQGSMRVSSGTLDMSAGALQAWQMRNTDLQVYEGEIDGDSETAVNAEQFGVYTMWE